VAKAPLIPPAAALTPRRLLRWVYLGRFALVTGMLVGALVAWSAAASEQTFLVTLMFLVALVSLGLSAWWTELMAREPGRSFLVGQVALDALLVTGVVHVTGGAESNFAWLYILVISEGALLVPMAGGLLLAALASILYFAVATWGQDGTLAGPLGLQIGLFALVAAATGVLGDRLRKTGAALGRMESELRRLRLDTDEILATVSSGVLTLDEDGRLLYLNPAGEALLGLDRGALEGRPAMAEIRAIAPELADILGESLARARPLYRLRSDALRGGEQVVLGVSTFVREQEGDPLAVTAIFQDITDLERLAILNRRAERLEAVAELSASLAHEIKNPLASIRSAVEQFQSPRLEDRDRTALTRMVVRESDRLSRLLTDFLDFSRSRVDRKCPVRIGELVGDVVTVARQHPLVEERKVHIEASLEDALVEADSDLVYRALLNLFLNAVQFSPEGARVTVTMDRPPESPGGTRVERPVRIRVRDQGPGIPAELQDRIFDPFYTTREGGSGLGLAVVYRMVEAHDGLVLVETPEGGGAEFQVYLPTLAEPSKET
jgi:two-component system, NtrC family, sensor histidine kinase PilS